MSETFKSADTLRWFLARFVHSYLCWWSTSKSIIIIISIVRTCFSDCSFAVACLLMGLVLLIQVMTTKTLGHIPHKPWEESADKVKMSSGGLVWIFMSLISSASHRKLMSLIRISSLSTHTSHHPIIHNQRTTHRVQDTVAHSHGDSEAFSPVMCQVFIKCAIGCAQASVALSRVPWKWSDLCSSHWCSPLTALTSQPAASRRELKKKKKKSWANQTKD